VVTNTGELLQLPKMMDIKTGEEITEDKIPDDLDGISQDLADQLRAALDRKERMVAIGEEAAQKIRLGERELRRRRQRRR
jgi:predicted transcriptional regulator